MPTAHPQDALAALTDTAPWPGAALIWAQITATADGKPPEVRFRPTR